MDLLPLLNSRWFLTGFFLIAVFVSTFKPSGFIFFAVACCALRATGAYLHWLLPAAFTSIAIYWVVKILFLRRLRLEWNDPLLILIAWFGISLLPLPWYLGRTIDTLGQAQDFVVCLAIALIIRKNMVTESAIWISLTIPLAFLTVWAFFIGCEAALDENNLNFRGVDFSAVFDRNIQSFHIGVLMVVLFSALCGIRKYSFAFALGASALLLLCVKVIMLYGSRSATLSIAGGVFILVALSLRNLPGRRQVILLLALVAIAVFSLLGDNAARLIERFQGEDLATGHGRLIYVQQLLSQFFSTSVEKWIFGVDNCARLLGKLNGTDVEGTHNGFLSVLVEQGMFGLTCFLFCIGRLFQCLWKNKGNKQSIWLFITATSLLTFALLENLTLDLRHNGLWWICIGVLLGLAGKFSVNIAPIKGVRNYPQVKPTRP